MSLFLITISHNLLKDVILESSSFEIKDHRINDEGHTMYIDFTSNTNVKELDDMLCKHIIATSNDTTIVRGNKESSYRMEMGVSVRVNHEHKEMKIEIDRTADTHVESLANAVKKYFGLADYEVETSILGMVIKTKTDVPYDDNVKSFQDKLAKSFRTKDNAILFVGHALSGCRSTCGIPFAVLNVYIYMNGHLQIELNI